MIVFSDFHHESLAQSLQLLFEKRLGHKIFFPTGMEWFYQGHWKIGDPYGPSARNTALQFLNGALPADGTGVVSVPNGMTFEQFKETPIDIMIASYYDHIPVYLDLIKKYHPQAKLITQYGNAWDVHPLTTNLLSSTQPFSVPPSVNVCWYHQEFDTTLYRFGIEDRNPQQLASFTNALPLSSIYATDWRDFQELEQELISTHICCSFGGGCRNGSLPQDV